MVIESRESLNFGAPRSFIGGIIHHPGIARKVSKRKERFRDHFGAQEEKEFTPVPTSLVEETVKSVFLSLKNGILGAKYPRDVFSGKDKEKDHLKDVFDWEPFLFVHMAFSKQLVHFKLLHKGGKHWE